MGLTDATDTTIVHGTAIALGGRAVLLRGPSGAGKSDLALRAMALAPGPWSRDPFQLVADDQVHIGRSGAQLTVLPHPRLAGLIEVRGLGILTVQHAASADLFLIADLVTSGDVERLPDPWPSDTLLGVPLPVLRVAPFEDSAPLKLALALTQEPWRDGLVKDNTGNRFP